MGAVVSYSLDEFVKDLQQAFATRNDLVGRANAVAETLQHLLRQGGWVQTLLDEGGYDALPGSVYVDSTYGHPAAGFHITCSAQKVGQSNTPHDHGASWVVYGTYQGVIEQTRWGWDYSKGLLQPQLLPGVSFLQQAGEVAYFLPGEIHVTRNAAADRSVVVRVEAQRMASVWRHRYHKETHTGKAFLEDR